MPAVSENPQKRHLVLVGLMGSGKSSVGRQLSSLTGRPFVDTDALVEAHARKRISEIFATLGEERFRELEHEMIGKALHENSPCIIATGGGAVVADANRQLLWQYGYVVYLQAGIDTLFERTSRDQHRPLLKTDNPRQRIADLLQERSPFYEQADRIVSVEKKNVRDVAREILQSWP